MNTMAAIPTEHAKRYLGQFVKHFSHKLPFVLWESLEHGEVEFPTGRCVLDADATRLSIRLAAGTAGDMTALQDVVARHLLRFAFREPLTIEWRQ